MNFVLFRMKKKLPTMKPRPEVVTISAVTIEAAYLLLF